MQHDEHFESRLDADLMAGFHREPDVNPALEEKVVEQLRGRGILAGHASIGAAAAAGGKARRRIAVPVAIAASIALAFSAGLSVGSAGRTEPENSGALSARVNLANQTPEVKAELLGMAALNFRDALASIDSADSLSTRIALLGLRAAGDEIIRIAPESEVAQALNLVSMGLLRGNPADAVALASPTRLVWY